MNLQASSCLHFCDHNNESAPASCKKNLFNSLKVEGNMFGMSMEYLKCSASSFVHLEIKRKKIRCGAFKMNEF